jgi:hypothetical protein
MFVSQNAMQSFSESRWFFLVFLTMWIGVTGLLARLSGWAGLARRFPVGTAPSGQNFRFVSGSMGRRLFPVSYGNCLFLDVGPYGLKLSILFLFRFQSPPMFIPWSQVESVTDKRILFIPYVAIKIRDQWPIISIRGQAAQCLRDTYARANLGGAV